MTLDILAIVIATVTIILAIIGTGIALGRLIVPSLRELRRDISGIHRDITGIHQDMAGLRERMARIEGLFEGFTKREAANTNS